MQLSAVIKWHLFVVTIFALPLSICAPFDVKASADIRDWQGFVNDLRDSWTSPILYLKKRGYLPEGTDHLLEEKINELQKEKDTMDSSVCVSNVAGELMGSGLANINTAASGSNGDSALTKSNSGSSAYSSSDSLDNSGNSGNTLDNAGVLATSGVADALPSSSFDAVKSAEVLQSESNAQARDFNKNLAADLNNAQITPLESLANEPNSPIRKVATGSRKSHTKKLHKGQQSQKQQVQKQKVEKPANILRKIKDKFVGLFSASKKSELSGGNKPAYTNDFGGDLDRDSQNDAEINVDVNSYSVHNVNGKNVGVHDFNKDLDLKRFIMKEINRRDMMKTDNNARELFTRDLLRDFNARYPLEPNIFIEKDASWKGTQDFGLKDLGLKDYNVKDFVSKDLSGRDVLDFGTGNLAVKYTPTKDYNTRELGLKDLTKDIGDKNTLLKDYSMNYMGAKDTPVKEYQLNDFDLKDFKTRDLTLNDYNAKSLVAKDFSMDEDDSSKELNAPNSNYFSNSMPIKNQEKLIKDYEKLLDSNMEKDRLFTKAVMGTAQRNADGM